MVRCKFLIINCTDKSDKTKGTKNPPANREKIQSKKGFGEEIVKESE